MRKEELPQDDSPLKTMTKELCYVKNNNGSYGTALSSGWEVKASALDNAWEGIQERIDEAKELVRKGEKSPIYYFMEKNLMDLTVLSGYVSFWRFQIKRHMLPKVFKQLNDNKLMQYAKAFNIELTELKTFEG